MDPTRSHSPFGLKYSTLNQGGPGWTSWLEHVLMTSCWGLLNFLFITELASNRDRTQKLMMNDRLKSSDLISESDNLKK